MPDNRGHLLPIYVVIDESASMVPYLAQLNSGLAALHEALLAEPMAAAKVRFTIIGFSHTATLRLHLADLRRENQLPPVRSGSSTSYGAAFSALLQQIPQDVTALKGQGYAIHRPTVFFLSDGQPSDGEHWKAFHQQLTDRHRFNAAPNIIACGIGDARPKAILEVATSQEYAFVSIAGSDVGAAVAKFCTALTRSVIVSGRAIASGHSELHVDRPEGFRMAIDVV
jgi:uncharacterized protein YegL